MYAYTIFFIFFIFDNYLILKRLEDTALVNKYLYNVQIVVHFGFNKTVHHVIIWIRIWLFCS